MLANIKWNSNDLKYLKGQCIGIVYIKKLCNYA